MYEVNNNLFSDYGEKYNSLPWAFELVFTLINIPLVIFGGILLFFFLYKKTKTKIILYLAILGFIIVVLQGGIYLLEVGFYFHFPVMMVYFFETILFGSIIFRFYKPIKE
jgi:hypothetical protein